MERPVKHPKVLLLGVSFKTRNMGVGALGAGAIKCVRAWRPGAEIKLLDYGKKPEVHNVNINGKDELIELVNLRFSKRVFQKNNVAVLIALAAVARLLPRGARKLIIGSNPYLREIAEADVAASVAGGDSFSDIYGAGRFFYVALPQVLVLLMGKPLAQLPQTIGPFASRLPRKIAAGILRRSSVVYSRDYPGLLETREILGISGKDDRIRFCYDMGFVLDPVEPPAVSMEPAEWGPGASQPAGTACTVGLNVSGLLFMGGYTRTNMFGLRTDYRVLVKEIIDFLITRKKASVLLVPHVFGSEGTESDSVVCSLLYSELKAKYGPAISCLTGNYDQGEIKHVIGSCDFFIGSRMHSCIAAISQCVPAVPVAYSRKFMGVMESVGVDSYVADPCSLEAGAILDIIDKAFEDRVAIAEKLRAQMPAVKEKVLALFREIQE